MVLQLILASKLGELEQFENPTANSQFASKYEFSGKWLHPIEKCKKKQTPLKIQFYCQDNITLPTSTFSKA